MARISVIMAVRNGLPYLKTAVDSILSQTLADLEFIIIDDASKDGSSEILQAYSDRRIKLVRNAQQKGLSKSLNRGIQLAKGKYITRMDHDDISLPTRLEVQEAFLETHPAIDVLGTWATTIGAPPRQIWRTPTNDMDIRCELIFNPSLIHSSIMFRRSSRLRYDSGIKRAQDYDLWCRSAEKVVFANINEVLLQYRIHWRQVGKQNAQEQTRTADEIRARHLQKLNLYPEEAEIKRHHAISRWQFSVGEQELRATGHWLAKLEAGNVEKNYLPRDAFRKSLGKRWLAACRSSVKLGSKTWSMFRQSIFSAYVPLFDQTILWAKCLSRQWGWGKET